MKQLKITVSDIKKTNLLGVGASGTAYKQENLVYKIPEAIAPKNKNINPKLFSEPIRIASLFNKCATALDHLEYATAEAALTKDNTQILITPFIQGRPIRFKKNKVENEFTLDMLEEEDRVIVTKAKKN